MIRSLLFVGLAFSLFSTRAAADPGIDFFESKIRPVMVEHCYACHSAEAKKSKGGLLLDTKAALLKGGESGAAIVPGKPKESLLVKAIHYEDAELRMPPKGKMPAGLIADLEKWVAMGAPDPRTGGAVKVAAQYPTVEEGRKFWAFQPIQQPAVPKVKDESWARNDVDRFLLNKIESQGLKPAPDARPVTLIRRLHFALIGLPPTIEEIDGFQEASARDPQKAIEELVDRLLASPHFGERWGRHWLDVARYADSSGGGRSLLFRDAWRYRDYVISSFNQDKSFDRFIIEQIAGDLVKAKTPEERRALLIATAFLLLGPTNYEHQDKPVLEMDIIDEQIDTIGRAFLGMTLGCARCHDHKFDPVPTKDYYALAGIFKSTKVIVHSNVSKWNEVALPSLGKEASVVKKHEEAVEAVKQKLALAKAEDVKAGRATEGFVKGAINATTLPGIVIDDEDAKRVGPWKHSVFTGNFVGKGYHYDDRAAKVEKTLTFQPDFPKSGLYEVRLAYVAGENRATNVPVRVFHVEGDDNIKVNQKKTPPIDGRWISLGKYRFAKGNQFFVMVATDGVNGHVVVDAVQFLPEDQPEVEAKVPAPPPGKQPSTVKELEAELKRLTAMGPDRATAMAVVDSEKVQNCNICIRGNYHNKGESTPRGTLQVVPATLGKIGAKESGRLQLAEWLVDRQNPLTARVTANRIWHHLFGTGIVRTVDNFGVTGETPSNPELLDHLAGRLVENKWSFKKMIREIVLSHAYQLSSDPYPAAEKADPENRLFARYSRRRLDAESLRDSILQVSGKLDLGRGGPVLTKSLANERAFEFTDTRRSVYTPILRNKLLEIFEVFDFPDPNVCNGRRNISTVSTQALYLMNSPFIMDQAKAAAAKLLREPSMNDAARLDRAYRSALGRPPSDRERELALAFIGKTTETERPRTWERVYQVLFACVDFRYVN